MRSLPTEVHPSALGGYKKMSVPLELGSQVVVHFPGVSNLILSPVTKFQPYKLSFNSVNMFFLTSGLSS